MAEIGRRFTGQLEIGSLKRLLPLLDSAAGSVDVELGFDVDEAGIKNLHGTLQATLILRCQRCLEAMEYPLKSEFHLAIIQSDSEAERLPETYEPLVVESTPMHIMDVIEDEILLSLPHIPMHEEGTCSIEPVAGETELEEQQEVGEAKPNPFAVLEKLKKDH